MLMRRRLLGVLAALLTLAAIGCSGSSVDQLVLRVEGEQGVRFSGHYVVTTESGARTQRAIEEQPVPFEVVLVGSNLSALVVREGAAGRLHAQILLNGQAVAFSAARDPLGLLTVATP